MSAQRRFTFVVPRAHDQAWAGWIPTMVCIAIVLVAISGCGRRAPRATVEGTLRFRGKPLDNCLVTFLPASASETKAPHSRGLTDREGKFRLCCDNQEDGAAVGSHRVTIQDLSVSTGVRRRDHGAADADVDENAPALPVHRSRVPGKYTSPATTPVSKEVKPGHQVIDLDIE